MEEIKINKQQEELFYEKIIAFEKDYIKSLFDCSQEKIKNNYSTEKLNEIQALILELIELQSEKPPLINPSMNDVVNHEKFREIKLKSLFKKIKKLSKEEGGFLFMPLRIIFYNFFLEFKNSQKAKKDKKFPQADNLLDSGIAWFICLFNY